MNAPSTTTEDTAANYFRCPVQSEDSHALVRVGLRKTRVNVQETSIDGFTVLVSAVHAPRLKVGRRWVLEYQGAKYEVHPQWYFNAPDGRVQVGLRRLTDLTAPPPLRRSLLVQLGGNRYEDPSYAAAVYGGFVLALFGLLALPGLGDRLGTATRIQNAMEWVVQGVDDAFGKYL